MPFSLLPAEAGITRRRVGKTDGADVRWVSSGGGLA